MDEDRLDEARELKADLFKSSKEGMIQAEMKAECEKENREVDILKADKYIHKVITEITLQAVKKEKDKKTKVNDKGNIYGECERCGCDGDTELDYRGSNRWICSECAFALSEGYNNSQSWNEVE